MWWLQSPLWFQEPHASQPELHHVFSKSVGNKEFLICLLSLLVPILIYWSGEKKPSSLGLLLFIFVVIEGVIWWWRIWGSRLIDGYTVARILECCSFYTLFKVFSFCIHFLSFFLFSLFSFFYYSTLVPRVAPLIYSLIAPCEGCAAPYGFRNAMPLSISTTQFAVRKQKIRENSLPETQSVFFLHRLRHH